MLSHAMPFCLKVVPRYEKLFQKVSIASCHSPGNPCRCTSLMAMATVQGIQTAAKYMLVGPQASGRHWQCDASLKRGRLRCARSHTAVHGTSADNPLLYAFNSQSRPASAPAVNDGRRAPYSASVQGRKMYAPAGSLATTLFLRTRRQA
jgi:hypothetical protein